MSATFVLGQTILVKGVVKDAGNGQTLPYVNIQVKGASSGTTTDQEGKYTLKLAAGDSVIRFTYIGYMAFEKAVGKEASQMIHVKMHVDTAMLKEVTVKGKAGYRNRDNPAVELIRQVIAHKDQNRVDNQDFAQYEQYEKMSFAMSNLSDRFKNRPVLKNYGFLFEQQDSAVLAGKNMLPAYMQEKLLQVYIRKDPAAKKQWIKADRRAQFDPKFVDNDGLALYFNRMYADINIYDNDIFVATNMLLSPVAATAPAFYKFFIRDTLKTHDPWLIELGFVPRNSTDMLFEGRLFVTLDGNYAVQNAFLTVSKNINLNFIRQLEARIGFEKGEDNKYYPAKTTLSMEFAFGEKGAGLLGQRTITLKNYQTGRPMADSVYRGPPEQAIEDTLPNQGEEYWGQVRHIPLERTEQNIYRNIDTLQTIRSFRTTMDIATVFLAGFKNLGKVEIGPVNTFYSFNPVEGLRLRFGGRTTPEFNKRIYFETYAAYGFNDQRWKYFVSGTYSLNNKSVYHFPFNYMRLSHQHDTKIPGQQLEFVQEDNFLLSFKWGDNNTWLYNDISKFEYVREYQNRLSFKLGFTHWVQSPAGNLRYTQTDLTNDRQLNISTLRNSEVNFELRYAPHEKFYQGKIYRTPLVNKYPVFTFRYNAGIRNVLDSENAYHSFTGNIIKRFYLSQFGYADFTTEGGFILGNNIPFPLLTIHRANQTYAYQLNSYNMMNFLEFVSDHYASLDVQYYMNGFLFNKIPLLKKLKLREVFSFKALYGGLRDENNPAYTPGLYDFPIDSHGGASTFALGSTPYMEASVGVANIFKLLRVDLVRRFNYLDNPGAPQWGVRVKFRLDF
ncbi:DUF5686 and carboxypeptidase regulatory-like domain-containing protein [Dyadobacter sp. CY261]|uniref:DUF5686 and carboxypeptidase-like regulatory domain-containing protein n=1 Tax=Dyadobacter sp. CY261 TaxID=2907203 RepID=UPI001F33B99D|nr:DUF5686 and carboxypeptidase-like regulatory domain-containing protein [Dyadobacter sp. CY261]MCF0075304.1 DUF5686 and carboxypeptidase regulatory-like domain-containing protein [Dyadobacter sp. CY261]